MEEGGSHIWSKNLHNKPSPITILVHTPHLDQAGPDSGLSCPVLTQHTWNAVQEMGHLPTKSTCPVAENTLGGGEVA